MKMINRNRKVKGFTLTEMIIVVAIIGILTAVLAPTMTTYYWKARVRTANSDAKMVYNAAQTAAQRAMSADKVITHASEKSPFCLLEVIVSYDASSGEVTYSTPGTGLHSLNTANAPDAAVQDFANVILNTVTDAREVCWAVYVSNYIVEASVSANNNGTNNVGRYSVGTHPIEKQSGAYSAVFESILREDATAYTSASPT